MKIEETKVEQLRKLDEFFYVLIADVDKACQAWEKDPCAYTRRCYIRAVMAFIEGNTFRFKQSALWYHENIKEIFSAEEVVCLKEEAISLKDNGKPQIKPMHISMITNLKFSLYCFSKAYNRQYNLDISSKGWDFLKKAIKKRDSITHPKNISDFNVTEDDVKLFEKASKFYRETTLPLIK